MKSSSLALNISYTRRHIAQRCQTLVENELLERHEDTAGYRISKKGRKFLNDELEPVDLVNE